MRDRTRRRTAGLRLGPLPPLQLSAETYLYKRNLEGLTSETEELASQKDVQLSVGFGLPFGHEHSDQKD